MLYFFIFIFSFLIVYLCGEWVVASLAKIARLLGWREFVIAFLIMALASSLPNLFVGIISAFKKIPELSFGEIIGGNLVDLTLAIAIPTFIAGKITTASRLIQKSSFFCTFFSILPLFLILDKSLSRGDGLILIFCFLLYLFWLFSKKERFEKIYEEKFTLAQEIKTFFKSLGKVILGIFLLLLAAEGIVSSAKFFVQKFKLNLTLLGIFFVGLGNTLPEIYFAFVCAKKRETWMILGNLMGAVIIPATLVLGIVSLICPIEIENFSTLALAIFFLIVSALFFVFFIKSGKVITKKEAVFLLTIYLAFIIAESLLF